MTRSLIVNSIAMIFGLALALWVWTSGDVQNKPKTVLLDWQPEQITHLEYTWPKGHTLVEYNAHKHEASVTLSVESEPEKKPAAKLSAKPVKVGEDAGSLEDAGLVAPVKDSAKAVKTQHVFPGGSLVLRGIKALAPLKASHDLGELSKDQLVKLGLDKIERRLLIRGPKAERVLELGIKSYGGQGVYARLQGQNKVYMISSKVVAGLEGPEGKLRESRILPIKSETVSAVNFNVAGKNQRFVQVDGAQKGQRYFALAASPENKSDEATTLISRLYGLRLVKYLQSPPAAATMNEVAKIQIERKEAEPVILSVFERSDGQGYIIARGTWFAELRSAQLRPLLDDLSALLSDLGQ